jgi:hypothetical protein
MMSRPVQLVFGHEPTQLLRLAEHDKSICYRHQAAGQVKRTLKFSVGRKESKVNMWFLPLFPRYSNAQHLLTSAYCAAPFQLGLTSQAAKAMVRHASKWKFASERYFLTRLA